MTFPSKQNVFDWVTQYWNILFGKRVHTKDDQWLLGPIGTHNEDSESFIKRLASTEGLIVGTNREHAGLLEHFDDWPISVHETIKRFYTQTSNYQLITNTQWNPLCGGLGFLVSKLFSQRIQQLNIPQGFKNIECTFGNEIIQLRLPNGQVSHTIWKRTRADTGDIVFYGIYSTCHNPSGEFFIKAVFPLPHGNATVLFRPEHDGDGNLKLISSGRTFGDPGFYFFVADKHGDLWRHYLPGLREIIRVQANADDTLQAEHILTLWALRVYRMTYRIEACDTPAP